MVFADISEWCVFLQFFAVFLIVLSVFLADIAAKWYVFSFFQGLGKVEENANMWLGGTLWALLGLSTSYCVGGFCIGRT